MSNDNKKPATLGNPEWRRVVKDAALRHFDMCVFFDTDYLAAVDPHNYGIVLCLEDFQDWEPLQVVCYLKGLTDSGRAEVNKG